MVSIRPAEESDFAAIQEIYSRCITEATWLSADEKLINSFADLSEGESVHVAVNESGVVLGMLSVYVPESFIHHLYVDPDARGASVGRLLLQSLGEWLPYPWFLKCLQQNRDALRFYRSCGWSEVGAGVSRQGNYVLFSCEKSHVRLYLPVTSTRKSRNG